MIAPSPTAAATGFSRPSNVRPTRCFAVTYYDGDIVLGESRQSVFRSKRLNRAKRIARSNMPDRAGRMELAEISFSVFNRRRNEYRSGLG